MEIEIFTLVEWFLNFHMNLILRCLRFDCKIVKSFNSCTFFKPGCIPGVIIVVLCD